MKAFKPLKIFKPDGNDLNFSAGPGALPASVLQKCSEALLEVPELKLSVLGISHRSEWVAEMIHRTESNILNLLGLKDGYRVLFLQGGGTMQFSMVPMLLLKNQPAPADYLTTGYWSEKAIAEAEKVGEVRRLWDGRNRDYRSLPEAGHLPFNKEAAYLHYVSNETVEGLQFRAPIGPENVHRVCDMSSDFLSQPIEAGRFSLIYAHAQKNLGPAGVTIVVIRHDLLERDSGPLPSILDYKSHAKANSIYNTPPVFAIYVVSLVVEWLRREIGGLEKMADLNRAKADLLYRCIDDSKGFYSGRADRKDRSLMNVTFNLPSVPLEQKFIATMKQKGISGLEGHRSIQGVRASLYNAVPFSSVAILCEEMENFRKVNLAK